jgi:hypothetical protein
VLRPLVGRRVQVEPGARAEIVALVLEKEINILAKQKYYIGQVFVFNINSNSKFWENYKITDRKRLKKNKVGLKTRQKYLT